MLLALALLMLAMTATPAMAQNVHNNIHVNAHVNVINNDIQIGPITVIGPIV